MEEKENNVSTAETTTAQNDKENQESNPEPENIDIVELLKNSQNEKDVLKLTQNLEKIISNLSQLKNANTLITENNMGILKKINEVDDIKINVLICKLYVKILSNDSFFNDLVSSISDSDISQIPLLFNLVNECTSVLEKVDKFILFEYSFILKNIILDLLKYIYVNHRKKLEKDKEKNDKLQQLMTDLPLKFFDQNYLDLNRSKELFNLAYSKSEENVDNLEQKFFAINEYYQQRQIFERFCQFNSKNSNFSAVGSSENEETDQNKTVDENFYTRYGVFLLKLCQYHNYIFLQNFKSEEVKTNENNEEEKDENVHVVFLLDRVSEFKEKKEENKEENKEEKKEENKEEKKEENKEENKEEKKEDKGDEKKEEKEDEKKTKKETDQIGDLMENKRFFSELKSKKYYDLLAQQIKNFLELSKDLESSNKEIKNIRNDLKEYLESVIVKDQYIPINLKEYNDLTIRDGFSDSFVTNVPAGKSNKFYVETKENKNVLVYIEFNIEDRTKDITVEINKYEDSLRNFKNVYQEEKVSGVCKFFIYCCGYSLYQIIFNNEYSWFNSKDVSYKVCLLNEVGSGKVEIETNKDENIKFYHYFNGKKVSLNYDEIDKKISNPTKNENVYISVLLYLNTLRVVNLKDNEITFNEYTDEKEKIITKHFFDSSLADYFKKNNLTKDNKVTIVLLNQNRNLVSICQEIEDQLKTLNTNTINNSTTNDNTFANYIEKIGFYPNSQISDIKVNYQLYDFSEQCLVNYLFLCNKEKKNIEKSVLLMEFDKLVVNAAVFNEGAILTKLSNKEKSEETGKNWKENYLSNININDVNTVVDFIENANDTFEGIDLVLSSVDNKDEEHKKKLDDLFEQVQKKCQEKIKVNIYKGNEIELNVFKNIHLFYEK